MLVHLFRDRLPGTLCGITFRKPLTCDDQLLDVDVLLDQHWEHGKPDKCCGY